MLCLQDSINFEKNEKHNIVFDVERMEAQIQELTAERNDLEHKLNLSQKHCNYLEKQLDEAIDKMDTQEEVIRDAFEKQGDTERKLHT